MEGNPSLEVKAIDAIATVFFKGERVPARSRRPKMTTLVAQFTRLSDSDYALFRFFLIVVAAQLLIVSANAYG
ncbi:MAG: hypothetical protein M3R59_08005, partial [Verrucomicrobiota bacterium]|nr:hypothetical protein [Verrucomicrobiota bacterium]